MLSAMTIFPLSEGDSAGFLPHPVQWFSHGSVSEMAWHVANETKVDRALTGRRHSDPHQFAFDGAKGGGGAAVTDRDLQEAEAAL